MILVCDRQRDGRRNTFLVEVGESGVSDTRFAAFRIQDEIGSAEGARIALGAIASSDQSRACRRSPTDFISIVVLTAWVLYCGISHGGAQPLVFACDGFVYSSNRRSS
jgi:hypothetical protein